MVSMEFFIDIILSGRTVALGLTQPVTEMSTRNISWGGKGGRCVGLTTLPPACDDCLEIWETLNLLEPSEPTLDFFPSLLRPHLGCRPGQWPCGPFIS